MRAAHRLTQRITTRQASAIAPTAGQGVNPAPTHMLPPVSLLVEQPEVGAFNPPKRLLMGPGPGNAHPRVHAAMALPQIGHMDGAFLQMAEEIKEMLRYAWQTKNPFTVPCSGTGSAAWEALCANLTSPGDKHLVLVNGYFGLRHCDMASRYGAEIIKLEKPWGEVFTPEEVDAACQEHKPDMIWVAHAETSTGACQPMDQLGEIARNHDCLLVRVPRPYRRHRRGARRRPTGGEGRLDAIDDSCARRPRTRSRRSAACPCGWTGGELMPRTPAARRRSAAPPASRP